jgi:hypothetical protein
LIRLRNRTRIAFKAIAAGQGVTPYARGVSIPIDGLRTVLYRLYKTETVGETKPCNQLKRKIFLRIKKKILELLLQNETVCVCHFILTV